MTAHIKRVLVGVDGSANSQRALRWAMALAAPSGGEVVVVHAVGLLTRFGDGPLVPAHAHMAEMRERLELEWCAPLASASVPSRAVLVDGAPALALLSAAEREQADVIVVGSRGEGGFAELRLGSTSQQLAEHADRPVLIVPPSQEAPHAG